MTPERHQHIKRLFLAAVELAPSEAGPFLDSACGDDQQLRGEVQSLLDHHRTETLLEAAQQTETGGWPATASPTTRPWDATRPLTADTSSTLPAGTMIANRYRLVAPLGRGGMGVVYRAEDTELGQTIALKFLSAALQQQPAAVEFLRREVRIARQITHPNVVRIFDIGTSGDETFISMEFVAGEDLGSLVRRVGPLPAAKTLEIAQQLAAGVAAAHAAGVLHRDLKPANVMIDGAGNVRILDFGIAAPLDDDRALGQRSGTPGFVAPEIIAGQKPSQRSDLFAWAIVVYYAALGRLPDVKQFRPGQSADDPLWSSGIRQELAACVARCLASDPERRPESAGDLVSALSGDPLGEALQAGRIPALGDVADAPSWQPSPLWTDGLLMAGLLLVALVMLLADRTMFVSRSGLVKSPAALEEIAEQVLVSLGHQAPAGPVLTGVTLDTDSLQYVRAHPDLPGAWDKVAAGEIPVVSFWYRQGDPRLPPPALLGVSESQRLAEPRPGTATVRLDGRGRLLSVQVADPSMSQPAQSGQSDWALLFDLAGLPRASFRESEIPAWPPVFADEVRSWVGPFPADPTRQVQVTAAALRGRVMFFDVDQPWEIAWRTESLRPWSEQSARFVALRTALWLVAIGVAAVLAWRHVLQGQADWPGTWRVAASVLVLASLDWLGGSRHTFVAAEELASAFLWLNVIVACGTIAGVAYLAVEPAARKWWPWSIITLRRLLAGRLADRGVWADALLGLVVGLGSVCLRQLGTLTNQLLGVAVSGLNDFDPSQNLLDSFGLRYKFAVFITALLLAVLESLMLLALVVALRRVTRSTLLAAVIFIVAMTFLGIAGRGTASPVDWLARTLLLSIAVWLLLRHGLLATITALTTFYAVNNSPITLEWSRWFAVTGFFVMASVTAALVAAWRMARGNPFLLQTENANSRRALAPVAPGN